MTQHIKFPLHLFRHVSLCASSKQGVISRQGFAQFGDFRYLCLVETPLVETPQNWFPRFTSLFSQQCGFWLFFLSCGLRGDTLTHILVFLMWGYLGFHGHAIQLLIASEKGKGRTSQRSRRKRKSRSLPVLFVLLQVVLSLPAILLQIFMSVPG